MRENLHDRSWRRFYFGGLTPIYGILHLSNEHVEAPDFITGALRRINKGQGEYLAYLNDDQKFAIALHGKRPGGATSDHSWVTGDFILSSGEIAEITKYTRFNKGERADISKYQVYVYSDRHVALSASIYARNLEELMDSDGDALLGTPPGFRI